MSYTVEFPIQYIPNPNKSSALGNGTLYIGQVNGNPAFEPSDRIQAYISRQGLSDLAISQPIQLSAGGVPVYNGSPVTLKVGTAYSIAVLNTLGSQVYYSPKVGEEVVATISNYADEFVGDGVTRSFTLTSQPTSIYGLDVAVDGNTFYPNTDYALSASTITLTDPLPDETRMLVKFTSPAGALSAPASNVSILDSGDYYNGSTVEDALQEIGSIRVNVTPEMFGAIGNGVADDTAKLQAAINYVSQSSSKAKTIILSGGKKYRIVGELTISAPIQIIGQGVYDLENTRGTTIPNGGCWFIHANTSGPLFRFSSNLSKGARLEKFGIFQEGHPEPGPGWTPAARDWVIRNENTQGTLHLKDLHFHNVYRGVNTDYAVRPRYSGITGQFFNRGFSFDRIYDTGSFLGLHAWTYWSEQNDVIQYTQANCVELTFLRTDGMWLDNVFTFGVATSVYFGLSAYGGTGRVVTFGNLYSDFCGRALVIDAPAAHVQVASMFHLGQSWPATPTDSLTGSCAVHIASGNNSLVQIGGLYSVLSEGAAVKVEGTANQVWINSELIEQYDFAATGQGVHLITDVSNSVKIATKPHLYKYGGGTAQEITTASTGTIQSQTVQKLFGNNTVNKPITAVGAAGGAGVVTVEGETNASLSVVASGTGFVQLGSATNALSFYGGASAVKGAITGSKGGNAALASLITYLAARGLLTDSTT